MVVKGEEEGIQAATQEETAVVFAAEAKRREVEGEGIPSLSGGKLPKDGIKQGARGSARAAASSEGGVTL